jgi:hypothetical protein
MFRHRLYHATNSAFGPWKVNRERNTRPAKNVYVQTYKKYVMVYGAPKHALFDNPNKPTSAAPSLERDALRFRRWLTASRVNCPSIARTKKFSAQHVTPVSCVARAKSKVLHAGVGPQTTLQNLIRYAPSSYDDPAENGPCKTLWRSAFSGFLRRAVPPSAQKLSPQIARINADNNPRSRQNTRPAVCFVCFACHEPVERCSSWSNKICVHLRHLRTNCNKSACEQENYLATRCLT